jgi:energy-coupling factor transporter ATP-binding protein EcfA2
MGNRSSQPLILVLGASGAGKTTLFARLARLFHSGPLMIGLESMDCDGLSFVTWTLGEAPLQHATHSLTRPL